MKTRLDHFLVNRGLAASRAQAQALIMARRVLVAGQAVTKAGALVAKDADLTLKAPPSPQVRRGAKLAGRGNWQAVEKPVFPVILSVAKDLNCPKRRDSSLRSE